MRFEGALARTAEAHPHWSYTGSTGPARWGSLEKEFSAARSLVRSPRHRCSECLLPLKEVGLSLSNQDVRLVNCLLAPLHQVLRRLSDLLRSVPHFGRKHRAAVQMVADVLGEIGPALCAKIRAAAPEIGRKFCHAEANIAVGALGDDVTEAVDEEQCALFRRESFRPCAV